MGEEIAFAGLGSTAYFCVKEDVGTEREKWHRATLGNFLFRDAVEIPELDLGRIEGKEKEGERKGFTQTITISLEPDEETKRKLIRFHRRIRKQWKGNRYYCRKLWKRIPKKHKRRLVHGFRKIAFIPGYRWNKRTQD